MDENPSTKLGRELVRISMGGDLGDLTVEILRSTDLPVWDFTLRILNTHGILPLLAYSLSQNELYQSVPKSVYSSLKKNYRDTSLVNQKYLNCLAEVVEVLRCRGIDAVLWKGCILADCVWPDLGTRSMSDLDLLISASERTVAAEALISSGFQQEPAMFINSAGISVDLLHMEFDNVCCDSDSLDLKHLKQTLTPKFIPLAMVSCLNPTAMLARLACHLARHSGGGASMGIQLRWLFDLHFVLRKWSADIDVTRMISLIDNNTSLAMLMRAIGFFFGEMGMHYERCGEIQTLATQFEPLSFEEILHSRRLGVWNLPTSEMGWLRFFAYHLRLRPRQSLMQPLLSDFALIPKDWMRNTRTRRRAAAIRKTDLVSLTSTGSKM